MKVLTLILTLILTHTTPAIAAPNCNTVKIKVNGMVCDFCARALEKTFGKRKEVSQITVDLDNSKVVVAMHQNQNINDTTLTQIVTNSGYDVVNINRECKNETK